MTELQLIWLGVIVGFVLTMTPIAEIIAELKKSEDAIPTSDFFALLTFPVAAVLAIGVSLAVKTIMGQ